MDLTSIKIGPSLNKINNLYIIRIVNVILHYSFIPTSFVKSRDSSGVCFDVMQISHLNNVRKLNKIIQMKKTTFCSYILQKSER